MNNQAIIEKIMDMEIKRFKKVSEDKKHSNTEKHFDKCSIEENIKKLIPMILKNLDILDKDFLNIESLKYIYDPDLSHKCHFLEINGIRHNVDNEGNMIFIDFKITDDLILQFDSINKRDDIVLYFNHSTFSEEYKDCSLAYNGIVKNPLISVSNYIENEIIKTPKLLKKINSFFCLFRSLTQLILLIEKSRYKFKIESFYNIELLNINLEKFDIFNLLYDLDIKTPIINLEKTINIFNNQK